MSSTPDERIPGSQVRQEFEQTKDEAAHLASSAAEAARSRGREQLDEMKHQTADAADKVADAIDSTAEDLRSDDGSTGVAEYGHNMADMMRRFAGGLRERDVEEFASELAGFARRSPGTFLAGSVALGFGVSRFLKATSQRPADAYRNGRDEDYMLMDDDEEFDDEEYLFEEEDTLDTTLQPSPSPDVTTQPAEARWPEDKGDERPDSAFASQHNTTSGPSQTEYSRGATGEPAANRSNAGRDSAPRLDDEAAGHTNLGGTNRE